MEEELEYKIENGLLPKVIYKYRSWDDEPNDHILRYQTIKLSSPKELLADYDEVHLPIDESLITEENLMEIALHTAKELYPNKHISYQKMKSKKLRRLMKIEDPDHRAQAMTRDKSITNEIYGLFCASLNPTSLKMWETYGNLNQGFAVGLYLKNVLLNPNVYGSCGIINYYPEGNPPKQSPYSFSKEERIEKTLQRLYNVPDSYDWEEEIRVSRINKEVDENGQIIKYKEEDRIISLEKEAFSEILLGSDISKSDREQIIATRNANLQGVPIYETRIEENNIVRFNEL